MRASSANRLAYLCLLPSMILLGTVIFYPIATTLVYAFCKVDNYGAIERGAGLANFSTVFHDENFLHTLGMTVVWTAGVVGFTILLSLLLAVVLNEPFRGRKIARAILMLPWASALVMQALVWRWILDFDYGMLNHLLLQLHLIHHKIAWLDDARRAFPLMIGIGVLVSVPFTTTVLLAGLQSIPHEVYEASAVDGARPGQVFWQITLPLLRPVLLIAVVMNTIYVFNSFPIIWTITGGGPADSTQILITYLYRLAFTLNQWGSSSAIAMITFVLLLGFSLFSTWSAKKREEQA